MGGFVNIKIRIFIFLFLNKKYSSMTIGEFSVIGGL